MDALLPALLGLAVGLTLGALGAALIGRSRTAAATAVAAAQVTGAREQLDVARGLYRELLERTETEARQRQAAAAAEHRVLQELAPVKDTLSAMQRTVTELEAQRAEQHAQLTQQLHSATASEERLSQTAEKLAAALSNNATRGVWGETQLRTLVESAGLLNRVDFTLQSTIAADTGTRRPDLVVHLPGGKAIAVDAKVPYADFIEASAIPATADSAQEARRTALLASHAKRVKAHVDALASKSYWTGFASSPEFTIAFIPNEPLLAAALSADPNLLEYAFAKRIALASPVSFWAVLKTVAFTWQQDVLTDDAKNLFALGKELYSRIATLSDHAETLRASLERTVTNYNKFAASLEQRVLVTARRLDALDETKVIGTPRTIDETPRPLTQGEFAVTDEPAP